eukprot:804669-Amphidinium_carterae.1
MTARLSQNLEQLGWPRKKTVWRFFKKKSPQRFRDEEGYDAWFKGLVRELFLQRHDAECAQIS